MVGDEDRDPGSILAACPFLNGDKVVGNPPNRDRLLPNFRIHSWSGSVVPASHGLVILSSLPMLGPTVGSAMASAFGGCYLFCLGCLFSCILFLLAKVVRYLLSTCLRHRIRQRGSIPPSPPPYPYLPSPLLSPLSLLPPSTPPPSSCHLTPPPTPYLGMLYLGHTHRWRMAARKPVALVTAVMNHVSTMHNRVLEVDREMQ